jgi:hypothetical protein
MYGHVQSMYICVRAVLLDLFCMYVCRLVSGFAAVEGSCWDYVVAAKKGMHIVSTTCERCLVSVELLVAHIFPGGACQVLIPGEFEVSSCSTVKPNELDALGSYLAKTLLPPPFCQLQVSCFPPLASPGDPLPEHPVKICRIQSPKGLPILRQDKVLGVLLAQSLKVASSHFGSSPGTCAHARLLISAGCIARLMEFFFVVVHCLDSFPLHVHRRCLLFQQYFCHKHTEFPVDVG